VFHFEEGINGIRSAEENDERLRDVSGHVILLGQESQGDCEGVEAWGGN
jgi:hypothetical protein